MTHFYVTWLIPIWHESFKCDKPHSRVTWLIHVWHDSFPCEMIIHVWHDSFLRDTNHSSVTSLIHMWHGSFVYDMTHSGVTRLFRISYVTQIIQVWHVSFIYTANDSCVTWLIYMWQDSFKVPIWFESFKCDKTHLYTPRRTHMRHDPRLCATIHTNFHIRHDSFTCDMTHMRHDPSICDMMHSYMTRLIHMWHDSFMEEAATCSRATHSASTRNESRTQPCNASRTRQSPPDPSAIQHPRTRSAWPKKGLN